MKKLLMIAALVTLFAGCSKDGETGPAGPQGATGATGNQGPDAKIYDFSLWFGSGIYSASYVLTESPAAEDVVMVYLTTNSSGWRSPLPYSGTAMGQNVNFNFEMGLITVFIDNTTNPASALFSFRAVVIKGHYREAHPEINWNNYNEVEKFLNLTSYNSD